VIRYKRSVRISVLLALFALILAACGPTPEPEPEPEPEVGVPDYVPTDITFYAMGDPQYGGGSADKNTFQVAGLNALEGTPWPADSPFAGEDVTDSLGVLIAGDLTQNGQDGRIEPLDSDQLGAFVADYGLTGAESELTLPVYEGYGNHDFEPAEPGDWHEFDWRFYYAEDPTPMVDLVSERNADRVGLSRVAPGDAGHYSWDWDWVHFVNVNLCPADEPSLESDTSAIRDPRGALSWLVDDLERTVADSGRPVVLMAHFGFDGFSSEDRWWNDEQQAAFAEAIDGYNVVAYIHGHVHATFDYRAEGLDVFNVGTPYYAAYNDDGRGHFTAFRITDEALYAGDVGWSPAAAGADPAFVGWSLAVDLEEAR
jgi:cytolysin (calcineurin-like family phosphatase)